jgi:hypothetical protein
MGATHGKQQPILPTPKRVEYSLDEADTINPRTHPSRDGFVRKAERRGSSLTHSTPSGLGIHPHVNHQLHWRLLTLKPYRLLTYGPLLDRFRLTIELNLLRMIKVCSNS